MDTNTKPDIAMAALGRSGIEAFQGNIEAMMKASQLWVEGCQSLGQTLAATMQAQFEQTTSAWKAMGGVSSFRDLIELEAGLSRSLIETTVTGMGNLAQSSVKVTEQSMAPIKARLTLVAEKLTGNAA